MQKILEWLLWNSRFFIIFAVISSIIASILMVGIGTLNIIWHLKATFATLSDFSTLTLHKIEMLDKQSIVNIISAMDVYLMAMVLLIFAIGSYELFIKKMDVKGRNDSKTLIVKDLDQLKDKLAKVIVMVLVVTFFRYAITMKYENVLDMLYLSIGIFLIALAIYFGHGKSQSPKYKKPKDK